MIEILTALNVIITGVYAYFTYRILKANRDVVEATKDGVQATIRPYVHFEIYIYGPLVEGILKNTGKTPAHFVRVRLEPEPKVALHSDLRSLKLLSATHSFLAPDRQIDEWFGTQEELLRQNDSGVFTGFVEYQDAQGRPFKENFTMDLNSRKDMAFVGKKNLADEVAGIKDQLRSIERMIERRADSPQPISGLRS